jgi:hypothetical protein
MAFYRGPKIVTNGLVLALDAANTKSYVSGSTTWNDLSGNNNHGTLTNGPTFSSANGGSIVFDGTNDYIDVLNSTSLNPTTISIGAWFYLNSLVTNQNIISKGFTSIAEPFVQYTLKMLDSSPFNTIQIQASIGGTRQTLTSATTLTTGVWYYAVGTYDGITLRMFINGIQDANTISSSGTITSYNTPVQVGRWGTQGSQYLNGRVATAQIYNRALSAAEIAQNYNAQKSRFNLT